MAYNCGIPVNRWAAKKHHKEVLKRRNTPVDFFSLEEYERHNYMFWQEVRLNYNPRAIFVPFKYWRDKKTHYFGPNGKKNLKEQAAGESRKYCRDICYKIMEKYNNNEDLDDLNFLNYKKFGNPWYWD